MVKKSEFQSFWGKVGSILKVLRKKRDRREYFSALFDSKILLLRKQTVLFVDGGANLGQGFGWFSSFYCGPKVTFHLFEPNPHCYETLLELTRDPAKDVKLFEAGISTYEGEVKFFGLSDSEGGKLSQGGSILADHNSAWYTASENDAITVRVIDFEKYLHEQSKFFDKIAVKMDIEGAEVDLLERLIETGSAAKISVLYVEFHSQFQTPTQMAETRVREEKIVRDLKGLGVKVRIWH